MYFFQSIIFTFLIICSSLFIYQNLSNKKSLTMGKKNIIIIFLFLIEGFMLLFHDYIILFVFLDFSCILAYLLKFRKTAILLSFINFIYLYVIMNLSWYYFMIYPIYLCIDSFIRSNRKDKINYFVSSKALFTSLFFFIEFNSNILNVITLILLFIYLYLLLKYMDRELRNYEIDKNENSMIFKIAHEVKNPIAVCKGYLDMIDMNNIEKLHRYIPIIRSEMNRSLMIMDDFLNLKRLTIKKDIMDFNLLIEDVEKTVESILSNKNIDLEVIESDEEELFIEGDYERLKQVLINLIKNAKEANATKIRLEVKIKKNNIFFKITDDGDGMSSKELKKIGQMFYTTKVSGTGIGISMSKEIMRLHQGTMKYQSLLGEGTTVTLTLPTFL